MTAREMICLALLGLLAASCAAPATAADEPKAFACSFTSGISNSYDKGRYVILLGFGTILDQGETTVRAGDIVVQRGTNHAWSNRSGKVCRIAFILIDGQFTDGL